MRKKHKLTMVDDYILPKRLDRRRKLTDEDKEDIRRAYKKGDTSLRKLAKEYDVDKRTIHFCVCPDKYETIKAQFRERRKDGRYYDKERNKKAIQNNRAYKREHAEELIKKGE